jgi:predicted AAA+ superfamily ATPase
VEQKRIVYPRLLQTPSSQSFFLFGPRGTGKTAWLRKTLPEALYIDLLDGAEHSRLLARPGSLADRIPEGFPGWVVIDEVQRVPEILNEVHRLIETRRLRFAMTGSSARSLRRRGVNLLAGRALTRLLHPLTAEELGDDFDLLRMVRWGGLPFACTTDHPADYLASYASTYLREEVQQEGLTRNIATFARFLESASFSQGSVLNMAAVARDCGVQSKTVEGYFGILEDLLLSVRVPVFTRRAKRRIVAHPKFYFFDAGVFAAIRPRGPLDEAEETQGAALETLVLQHLRAVNDYFSLGYTIHYWRTAKGDEVDFVLYGERGCVAIEVKRSSRVREDDLRGLRRFLSDYPGSRALLTYAGNRTEHDSGIDIVPLATFLPKLRTFL